jgi:hypothetical protein
MIENQENIVTGKTFKQTLTGALINIIPFSYFAFATYNKYEWKGVLFSDITGFMAFAYVVFLHGCFILFFGIVALAVYSNEIIPDTKSTPIMVENVKKIFREYKFGINSFFMIGTPLLMMLSGHPVAAGFLFIIHFISASFMLFGRSLVSGSDTE